MKKLLRVVTQASASGAYGGPFDTAFNQTQIVSPRLESTELLAATLKDDVPSDAAIGMKRTYLPAIYLLGRRHPSVLVPRRMITSLQRSISDADVVHVSMGREVLPFVAVVLASISNKRLIVQTHGMLYRRSSLLYRIFDSFITRPLLRRADIVVALTETERAQLVELEPTIEAAIVVIGNPTLRIEIERQRSALPAEAVVFIARLHARKNPMMFARAADTADREHLRGTYVVFGPDGGELAPLLASPSIGARLRYEGSVSGEKVAGLLQDARIFVLCSSDEPWGNVLMSAVALGRPVIATRSTHMGETLRAAGCAILVDDNDHDALARAVDHILGNDDLYDEMARSCAEFATKNLSDGAQLRFLLKVYGAEI